MNNKFLYAIATAACIAAAATTSLAAPLPAGTLLRIVGTTDAPTLSSFPCSNGSCFGVLLIPGLYYWTPIFPGTDGGIIIGKPQQPGELTEAWTYGGSTSTFFTTPSDAGNIFDDASCTGSGCGSYTTPRKTDLAVWNAMFNGNITLLGSAAGCDPVATPNCTTDQLNGIFVKSWTIDSAAGTWSLEHSQVMKSDSGFINFPFALVLRGTTGGHVNLAPVASDVQVEGAAGVTLTWKPVVSDPDGPNRLTCFIGTPLANGTATVAADCSSGSYISGLGFSGIDSFTYGANDGLVNSNLATVTAGITGTPSTACALTYPIKQYTYSSKKKITLVVTGNIKRTASHEVRICPTTQLEYNATSPAPYNYPVTCYINNIMVPATGSVSVGSQLKCNVRPYAGGDEYKLNIKSAI